MSAPLASDGRTSASIPALSRNTGALAAAAWCAARELFPKEPRWAVTVALDATLADAVFVIEIYAEEWGFSFRRGEQASWIRVTDIPFVHGRDQFALLRRTPRLDNIGDLVRLVETEQELELDRRQPLIRSSIGGEDRIAAWVASL